MRFAPVFAAACLAAAALPAHAGRLGDLSIYDRTDGRYLPVYGQNDRHYVIGEPGHRYEVHVRGTGPGRVLAVTSVDGVNVLSGETAATQQTGYVVNAGEETVIDGWRKSLDQVAAFYFTRLPNSYAARTGRPGNVGVIGVALFREKTYVPPPPPCCWPESVPKDLPREDSSRDELGSRSQNGSDLDDRAAAAGAAQDAPATKAAPSASAREELSRRKSEKLGTGHGERLNSQATYVDFERASDTPDEVLTIWYDSRTNLADLGVIPRPRPVSPRHADPFPASFVPDP